MSIERHEIQRIRAWSESSFATDGTSSPGLGSFTEIPAREGTASIELTTDSIDHGANVQHVDQYREEVLGKRSCKLTMTLNLSATGTAAVTATTAVTSGLGMLLKASMGAETLAAGSTSSTGSTATVVNVQTGHGSRWVPGGVMGWVNSSGALEVREVESISTDAITLKYAFSGSPANGNNLYNAALYTLAQDPTESLQFLVAGAESDDRWLLMGCQLTSMAIAVDPTGAQLPSVTVTYEGATYLESDETAGSITGSIGTATYSAYTPIANIGGEFRVSTVGTSTMSTTHRVHASAIALQPKLAFDRVTSPSGTMTVLRWRRKRVAPVLEGSWTHPFQDLTWTAARDSKADMAVRYQIGQTAGSTVYISAPTVQIVAPQRVADPTGLAGQTVAWKARLDTDVGATTTDVALSAIKIALV